MLCVWLGLALSAGPAAAQGDPGQGDPATASPYPWNSAAGVCDRAAGPPEDVNAQLSELVRAEADLDAAVAACRDALAAAPDDLRLRFQAGRILLAAGERAGLQPIESAAIAGYAPAELFWGIAHFTAAFGVLPAPATGARWLKRAAAQGLLVAQLLLGRAYVTGQGVPRDLERAEGWFRTAAASEEPVASMSLGGFLAINKIDPTAGDLEEARNLLESAVRADVPAAKFLLGRLLLEDRPFDRDVARALVLYRQAASQGVPGVAALLVEKLAHGEDFGVDVEEAKTWACTLEDPERVWHILGDGSLITCDDT
jgi:hypothetical protein